MEVKDFAENEEMPKLCYNCVKDMEFEENDLL